MKIQVRFSHYLKFLPVLAVILALPLGIGPAGAAKPNCDLDPSHASCKPDGGDGDGIMTLVVPITAQWTGTVSEATARDCNSANGSVANGGVGYTCSHPGAVDAAVTGADTVGGKDGEELCPMLANLTLGGANDEDIGTSRITSYFLSHDTTWNDGPCVDSAECLVMSSIWTFFDDWCDNSKCGRLVIFEGWGNVLPAVDGDLNPFKDDQSIEIDELTVTFMGIGKNRAVATCTFTSPGITVVTEPPD